MMKKITLFMFAFLSASVAFGQQYVMDYDVYDQVDANETGSQHGYIGFALNTNPLLGPYISDISTRWAVVDFSELLFTTDDANYGVFTTLPAGAEITVDSFILGYSYYPSVGSAGDLDVTVSIYNSSDLATDQNGFPNGALASPVNGGATALWTTSLDSSDIPQSASETAIDVMTLRPNLSLAAGETFAVVVTNTSDTLENFQMIYGFKENCGNQELALLSAAPYNSIQSMYLGPNNYAGSAYIGVPSFENCPDIFTQNMVVNPYVTLNYPSLVAEVLSEQSFSETCPGSSVPLEAIVAGGSGNYTYSWSPATGLNTTTGSQVIATVGASTQVYTVTITDTDDASTVTASINVVSWPVNVNVPGPKDITLSCGQTTNINATATVAAPAAAGVTIESITWSGGNANPLQVSTQGQYIVTAISSVGCLKTDTVNVSVLGSNNINFTVGSTLCPAPAVAEIQNASERTVGWGFTWYVIQGGDTIGQPGGETFIFQFPTSGTYQVALVADSADCEFSRLRTVTVASGSVPPCFTPPTGISDITFNNYSVYPNPASSVLNVDFALNSNEDVEISVISIEGKVIETLNFNNTSVVNTAINTSSMNNGVYILRIKTENGISTQKFVVSQK